MQAIHEFLFKLIWSESNTEFVYVIADSKGQATRKIVQQFGDIQYQYIGEI